ncbi:MAG: hypothetical protein U0900_01790 [Myxococcota bacterium]
MIGIGRRDAGQGSKDAGASARGLAAVALVALAGLLFAPALGAEPHRVEVVGTYPIREALRGKVNPRDEAIQKALWEAVSRVSLELMGEEGGAPDELDPTAAGAPTTGPAPDPAARAGAGAAGRPATAGGAVQPDPTERFRKIFGRDVLPYTRSFRIVEDRGERPVLFAEDPGVRREYLVVVEVLVDLDRVKGELARAGLLEPEPGPGVGRTVTLELLGLDRYAALQRLLETLRRSLSARRIETLEFGPGRQLVRIESPFGPEEMASRLGQLDTAELILDPVEVDPAGGRIRVMAQFFEPVPAGEEGGSVTASPDAAGPIRP